MWKFFRANLSPYTHTYEKIRKKQEKNISSCWRRGGGRKVYLKVIFKKVLIFRVHIPRCELIIKFISSQWKGVRTRPKSQDLWSAGLFLKILANHQLKNLLMEPQRHLGFSGLELLSRLKEVDDHIISYSSNLFLMSVNNLFAKILDDPFLMYLY